LTTEKVRWPAASAATLFAEANGKLDDRHADAVAALVYALVLEVEQ
jgi:hypothetical protein